MKAKQPPNSSRLPFISYLPKLLADPCKFILDAHNQSGDVISLGQIHKQSVYIIANPNDVQYVLQDNYENFMLGGYLEKDKIVFGKPPNHENIVQRKRQKQPAFSRKRTESHIPLMIQKTESMLASLKYNVPPGSSIDMLTVMRKLSLSINGQILFGTDIDNYLDGICPILTNVMRYFTYRNVLGYAGLPEWFPIPGKKDFQTAQEFLNLMVELHDQDNVCDSNLLSILKDSYPDINTVQYRLAPLLFASYETTASTLTWFFYVLANQPQLENCIREEIACVIGDGLPTPSQLLQLKLTNQVIHEVLRLFPPVFLIGRVSKEDDVIGGYHIPANSFILISPYLTHRHGRFWHNPDQFNPDNFSDANLAKQHSHAYIPFGSGPHVCMGRRYALTELPLIISMVLQSCKFEMSASTQPIQPRPMPTLLPQGGMPMRFYPSH